MTSTRLQAERARDVGEAVAALRPLLPRFLLVFDRHQQFALHQSPNGPRRNTEAGRRLGGRNQFVVHDRLHSLPYWQYSISVNRLACYSAVDVLDCGLVEWQKRERM